MGCMLGASVATVLVDGEDVGERLIAAGLAKRYDGPGGLVRMTWAGVEAALEAGAAVAGAVGVGGFTRRAVAGFDGPIVLASDRAPGGGGAVGRAGRR